MMDKVQKPSNSERYIPSFHMASLLIEKQSYLEFSVLFSACLLHARSNKCDAIYFSARGSVVVKALCYKLECRGFDTRSGDFFS
jgi:hypothetical protein